MTTTDTAFAALGIPDARYSQSQKQEIVEFIASLEAMTDADLSTATERYIWLSAYANNNPRSAYHPMCDATYAEWQRRGNPEGYSVAHKAAMRSCGY